MTTLDRKLLRVLWHLRGQILAIALMMGTGVATVVMELGTLQSLQETQAAFYDRYRFADIFAYAKRAPRTLVRELAELDGIAQVEARIVHQAILDMPAMAEPALARLVSIPDDRQPHINDIIIRSGRRVEAENPNEVIVNESFAEIHDLDIGDTLVAIINGKKRGLRIVGTGLSPEFVYVIGPGEIVPDDRRFAILWMSQAALEAMLDLKGAFNEVVVRTTRSASKDDLIDELDMRLAPFGGTGAYDRKDQVSHAFLQSEMDQLKNMTLIIPPIFLLAAAFLVNIVVNRMIDTEREQIGLFKAFGYRNRDIGFHYLRFVLVIAGLGIGLGWAFGIWLGQLVTELYTQYFRFPFLYYTLDPRILAGAAAVSAGAAILGALNAVRRAVNLPPAVAMQPPPPTVYRETLVERLGFTRSLDAPMRIMIRHIVRWPARSLTTVGGIAAAITLLVMSFFFIDALDDMIETYFFRALKLDVRVQFSDIRGDEIRQNLRRLPGVQDVELFRVVPAYLEHGPRRRRLAIIGIEQDAQLFNLIDESGRQIALPPQGLALGRKVAAILDVDVGDVVQAAALEGRRTTGQLFVNLIIREDVGLSAYMDRGMLNRFMGDGMVSSGSDMLIDWNAETDFFRELKEIPVLHGLSVKRTAVQNFRQLLEDSLLTMVFIFILFSSVISVGIVYNSARISLAERSRELASLRVLGFRRQEVARIVLGELAILTVLALPVGCVFGYGLCALLVALFETELYRLPLVVEPSTYGFAVLIVIVSTIGTGLVVARRISRLDLIAALKTKE